MKIREFYGQMDGDYEGVLDRFSNEARIGKFVKLFPKDPSYETLEMHMADNRIGEAFRAAHCLKGVCLNLGFVQLYESVSFVTEALRAEDPALASAGMPALRREYNKILDAIGKLD